jgi:hypothetical protein
LSLIKLDLLWRFVEVEVDVADVADADFDECL